MSRDLDARRFHNPDPAHATALVERAQAAAGSRNLLAARVGISRRRLGYIEAGHRRLPDGRVMPVTLTYAEQVILEDMADGR